MPQLLLLFFFLLSLETKTNSFSFCSCACSGITVRRLAFLLHEILYNHFLASRICYQWGGNKKRVLTILQRRIRTLSNRTYMYYLTEGKLSGFNFKARRKKLTVWKYCDFKHEKFIFLCPNENPLENEQNERRGKMRCILKLTY